MLKLQYSAQFKKDFKKVTKLPISDIVEVGHIVRSLQLKETLPPRYCDHALTGQWFEYRDCHIKPDLVLIYKIEGDTLKLARIGAHSELFG